MWRILVVLLALAPGGCDSLGGSVRAPDAPPDMMRPDEGTSTHPLHGGRELTSAGGRLTSASYQLHVELGGGLVQRSSAGATHRLTPSIAITP